MARDALQVRIHPIQLVLRFALEVAAAWSIMGAARVISGEEGGSIAALIAGALIIGVWVTFNVPGDPSRSGKAPVPVSGGVRLGLELAVFVLGALGFALSARWPLLAVFVAAVVAHHIGTAARIRWLLAQGPRKPTSS